MSIKKSRFKKGLKVVSAIKNRATFSGRLICLLLIVSLLSTSTFAAAPIAVVGFVIETVQDARFAFLSSNLSKTFLKTLGGEAMQPSLMVQTASVNRIRIFPGSVTVEQDQQIILSAIAYDGQNAQLSGIGFNWSKTDVGRGLPEQNIPDSKFQAQVPGTFKLTAKAGGKQADVTITVTPTSGNSPFLQSGLEPTREISSRSEQPIESPKSKNFEQSNERNLLPEEGGWNDGNWQSADDPGNEPGNPPGSPPDGGAGSGNFQFSAPVISLPGRGVDLALSLNYNSRLWNKSGSQLTYDIDRGFPAPGWSLGFGKIMDMGENGGSMMIDADGTRHGFGGNIAGSNGYTSFAGHTTDGTFIDYYSSRTPSGIPSA